MGVKSALNVKPPLDEPSPKEVSTASSKRSRRIKRPATKTVDALPSESPDQVIESSKECHLGVTCNKKSQVDSNE